MAEYRKQIVVLIDCWDYNKHDLDVNIQNDIRHYAFSNIKKFIANNHVDLIVDATYENRPIHPILKPIVTSENCIKILELSDFENKVLDISKPLDIYYMGMHWKDCVKHRPIGWKNVLRIVKSKAIDCRILFKNKTLIDEDDERTFECWPDFDNDKDSHNETLCSKINNGTWQLRPNATI